MLASCGVGVRGEVEGRERITGRCESGPDAQVEDVALPIPAPAALPRKQEVGVWPYASFLFALAKVSCWVERGGSVVRGETAELLKG